uniref:Plexin-B n=1 Tax=Cacopsylla melanoneura TaxID=428564 RepID=A0A8D8STZ2_9HEMI
MSWPFFVMLLTVSIIIVADECASLGAPHSSQRTKEALTSGSDINDLNITIVSVEPNPVRRYDMQNSNVREFYLKFENFQEQFPKSCCDFTFGVAGKKITTSLTSLEHTCPTNQKLLEIIDSTFSRPLGRQNVTVGLSVRLADDDGICRDHPYNKLIVLATTSIVIVDCNSYTSCTECISSPCRWCVNAQSCLNPENDGSYCGESYIILSSNRDSCPMITETIEGSNEIMVPYNDSEALHVSLNTRNIHQFDCLKHFICQFKMTDHIQTVDAKLAPDNEMITCDSMNLKYTLKYSNVKASFSVLWKEYKSGKYKLLDNPNNIHLKIYKCWDLAHTCDRCFSLNEKYGCGWCERSDSCETSHECAAKGPGVWLDRSHTCTNPEIESVVTDSHNQYWPNSCPKGTPTGGTHIDVFGQRLDSVQKPRLYVLYKGSRYPSACEVQSSSHMKCKAPAINVTIDTIENKFPQNLDYGFDMDQFSGFQNMSRKLNNSFMLFPDPVYDPFDDKIRYKSDYLTINGKYLDLVFDESDVTVRIGIEVCNVTSIANNQLTCIPPAEQPSNSLDDNPKGITELPNVTVIVGSTLSFYIGKLSYSQPDDILDMVLYGGIGIIMVVALSLTSMVFLIAYRCTSRKRTRVIENIQNENADILEVRVAPECRTAFAELIQT